ncbi:hypothetical protein QZH41_001842 [Actinostola sp. cb2023]|nr:hypothetical protein QZH41_001842 [Actinostola sp. cb2023]
MEDGICKLDNGRYQMSLPLKSDRISLPYNRPLAEKRWRQLNSRFKENPKFLKDYKTFMEDVVDFLQGPDLLNGLLGVLCHFREEKIAFMVDVKSMFHQFYVSEQHRDLLRFLWWEDGDQEKDVIEYRMKVHLFGRASSPGCANFGLKRADDDEEEFGAEAVAFIYDDFYVDDGFKSAPTVSEAINLIKSSKAICAKAGMRLHMLICNSKEILQANPIEDRSKSI